MLERNNTMDTLMETIKTRRSNRKYKSDMVPKEIIQQITEAGTYAPTGMNKQSPIIIAVTNQEIRNRIAKTNQEIGGWKEDFDPFYGAPVILAVLADKNWVTRVNDGSLVMGNLMLAAHELGLGSCWIHRAKETFEMTEWKEWLQSLGIEGEYEGIAFCALGYIEGEAPQAAPRKKDWVYFAD